MFCKAYSRLGTLENNFYRMLCFFNAKVQRVDKIIYKWDDQMMRFQMAINKKGALYFFFILHQLLLPDLHCDYSIVMD